MKHLLPPQGTADTIVDRLLAYITPYDPDFPNLIQGASDKEILEYCERAGFKTPEELPVSYHTFLKAMGTHDGFLFDTCFITMFSEFQLETELDVLWEMYSDNPVPEAQKSKYAYVADTIKTMFYDTISLDLTSKTTEPRIVVTNFIYDEEAKNIRFHSQSWEHLVMQSAVLRVEPRRLPLVQWYACPVEDNMIPFKAFKKEIDQLLDRLGLTLHWPGDARYYIAISENISLFIDIDLREMMCFTDTKELLRVVDAFAEKVNRIKGKRLKFRENGLLYEVKN